MSTSLLAPPRPVQVTLRLEPAHGHVRGCFWDVVECRWSCETGGAAGTTPGVPRP
jgi:hypothetical protein